MPTMIVYGVMCVIDLNVNELQLRQSGETFRAKKKGEKKWSIHYDYYILLHQHRYGWFYGRHIVTTNQCHLEFNEKPMRVLFTIHFIYLYRIRFGFVRLCSIANTICEKMHFEMLFGLSHCASMDAHVNTKSTNVKNGILILIRRRKRKRRREEMKETKETEKRKTKFKEHKRTEEFEETLH